MNAYVVQTKDMRSYTEPIMDDGSGPQIPYLPISPVVAATRGKAKSLFLREFNRVGSGVYDDDWNDLRVRLLAKDVELDEGVYEFGTPQSNPLWLRVHELDDHGGKPCDCPDDDYPNPGERSEPLNKSLSKEG